MAFNGKDGEAMNKKIIKLENLPKAILGKRNGKTVFLSGVFDLFHYAHFKFLQSASTLGEKLIVQVDGNELVKKRKGENRPYLDENKRADLIASFEFVNFVFISNLPSENPTTLKTIRPTVFVRAIIPEENNKNRKTRENQLKKIIPEMKINWQNQMSEISTTKILTIIKDTVTFKQNL
jgi:cytidyltransferase-like protein